MEQKTALTLEEIYQPIQDSLPAVESKILEILTTANPLSSEVIHYFFQAKGKFLRPALVLFGASFGGGLPESAILTAAALEIFHSATLIHDDIIDSAYLRRNLPTVHAKWNPQVAVLVGDYLHDNGGHFTLHAVRTLGYYRSNIHKILIPAGPGNFADQFYN